MNGEHSPVVFMKELTVGECSHDRILACYDACRSMKSELPGDCARGKKGREGNASCYQCKATPLRNKQAVSRPVSARVVPLIRWDILAHTRTVYSDHIAAQQYLHDELNLHIAMGRAIDFEFKSGNTETASMSYKTFLDNVLPEFTYEEALAFPSSGVYTGPCMDKLYDLCMEYAHMTDYDLTEVVSCRFC